MELPSAVTRQLQKMLPASYVDAVTLFAFVPDFPDRPGKPDLVITTHLGELVELRDRRVVGACSFSTHSRPKEIILHHGRSREGIPSYILVCDGDVFIFARDEVAADLRVAKKISDVSKLVVDDANCTGESSIRIWRHDEAIPIMLDNSTFNILIDDNYVSDEMFSQDADDDKFDSLLRSKLSEARLNTAKNAKVYEERRKFRQKILHVVSEDSRYEIDESINTESPRFDKLLVGNVWQRMNNGKWVIGISIENVAHGSIEDLELLIRSEDCIFTYDTKIYTHGDISEPFWILNKREQKLESKTVVTVVGVSDMPTFEHNSRVKLNAAVRYQFKEKSYCIPLPIIEVKASEVVSSRMDPILNKERIDRIDLSAIASTSLTVGLDIRYVTPSPVKLENILIESLKFSRHSGDLQKVLYHAVSPRNILHGIVIYITENADGNMDKIVTLTMSESQLLMLINLMYELIPVRCVIVPADTNVKFKKGILDTVENESEEMDICSLELDSKEDGFLSKLSLNLFQQMSEVSQHLERCMEVMSELKIDRVTGKSDTMSIDVTGLGDDTYQQLWSKLKEFTMLRGQLLKECPIK